MKRTMDAANCSSSLKSADHKQIHRFLGFRFPGLSLVFMLALAIAPALHAQATGSIAGNVNDKSGSGVAGATVIATTQATGLTRDTRTDSAGHYLLPLLPVGNYTVHVDANGFQSAESINLRLQVDEARELDFSLVPATVVTTVAVTGDAVAVESANPSLGQVITSQAGGRSALERPRFCPARHPHRRSDSRDQSQQFSSPLLPAVKWPHVAPSRSPSAAPGPNSTDWLLDGVDNNELTAGGISIFSSIDDIQEFKVLDLHLLRRVRYSRGPHRSWSPPKVDPTTITAPCLSFVRNTDSRCQELLRYLY